MRPHTSQRPLQATPCPFAHTHTHTLTLTLADTPQTHTLLPPPATSWRHSGSRGSARSSAWGRAGRGPLPGGAGRSGSPSPGLRVPPLPACQALGFQPRRRARVPGGWGVGGGGKCREKGAPERTACPLLPAAVPKRKEGQNGTPAVLPRELPAPPVSVGGRAKSQCEENTWGGEGRCLERHPPLRKERVGRGPPEGQQPHL